MGTNDDERDYAEEMANRALMRDESELELTAAELVAEHTGRPEFADAPVCPVNAEHAVMVTGWRAVCVVCERELERYS